MSGSDQLDNPFFLARALEPLARAYLASAQAIPGRNRGFMLLDTAKQRNLSSKTRYDQVGELSADDPLKYSLKRWVHRLTEMRVNQLWLEEDERKHRHTHYAVREPLDTSLSLHDMQLRALSSTKAESLLWLHNVDRNSAALSAHRAEYLTRCAEIHFRLGEGDVRSFWSPQVSRAPLGPLLEGGPFSLFELLQACQVNNVFEFITMSCGLDHQEGWPGRLSPDSLLRLVHAPELFRGVSLAPGPLPERLAPASFLRAAFQIGRALSLAWAPSDRPLILLRDADDLAGHRLGYLLVLWQLSAAFDQKVLNLGRSEVKERRRSAAQLVLGMVVSATLRAQLFELGLQKRPTASDVDELSAGLFQVPLHVNSVFAWFCARRDETARLAGLYDAVVSYQEMVDEFDEDWFRNPRALEKLRSQYETHAAVLVEDARLVLGRDILLNQIAAALD